MGPQRTRGVALVLVAALTGATGSARADGAGDVAPAAHAAAREHFTRGMAAFDAHDYRLAGREFDDAYAAEPHPDALWDSAQAWERAQEEARAANRYALYLDTAPAGAPDRDRATAALAHLSPHLARVVLRAPEGASLDADGEPARTGTVYLFPGAHELHAKVGGAAQSRSLSLDAGEVRTVVFAAEASLAPAPPPPSPPARAEGPVARAPGGLSPWFVVAGGVATLGMAAVTTWSGLDTVSARDAFVASQTQANLDAGRSRELRTNELLVITGVLGLATGVAALFVHWGGDDRGAGTVVGVGPSSLRVQF